MTLLVPAEKREATLYKPHIVCGSNSCIILEKTYLKIGEKFYEDNCQTNSVKICIDPIEKTCNFIPEGDFSLCPSKITKRVLVQNIPKIGKIVNAKGLTPFMYFGNKDVTEENAKTLFKRESYKVKKFYLEKEELDDLLSEIISDTEIHERIDQGLIPDVYEEYLLAGSLIIEVFLVVVTALLGLKKCIKTRRAPARERAARNRNRSELIQLYRRN